MFQKKQVRLETPRLWLAGWEKSDAPELYAYAKNVNVGPHAGWTPHKDVRESQKIIKEVFWKAITWKLVLKETNQIIGCIGLEEDRHRPDIASKEMGYSLDQSFWGKGLMTEAGNRVMAYGFQEMGLEILAIQTGVNNIRSQRVIKKLGFQPEGLMRQTYRIYDGTIRDALIYSLTKKEWEERQLRILETP